MTRNQLLAIAIALAVHLLVLIVMMIRLPKDPPLEPEEELVELLLEPEELVEQDAEDLTTNQAANENAERTEQPKSRMDQLINPDPTNLSEQQQELIRQQVEQELRELERETQQSLPGSQSSPNASEGTSTGTPIQSPNNNNGQAPDDQEAAPLKTRVSYDLPGRTDIDLYIPVYLCESGGTVVLDVTVNSAGSVVKAEVNREASHRLTHCLMESARKAALRSTFDQRKGSQEDQRGTITYIFAG